MINYKRLCDEIETIFTAVDMEKDPLKKTKTFLPPSILDPKDFLTDAEEVELDQTLMALGIFVKHNRLLIKPFFQDKDKSRSGFIAFSRFRSIFDNFKIKLTEREYQLIEKRFQAKSGGMDRVSFQAKTASEINYVEFDFVLRKYSGDDKPF